MPQILSLNANFRRPRKRRKDAGQRHLSRGTKMGLAGVGVAGLGGVGALAGTAGAVKGLADSIGRRAYWQAEKTGRAPLEYAAKLLNRTGTKKILVAQASKGALRGAAIGVGAGAAGIAAYKGIKALRRSQQRKRRRFR
jgi:hypothetical protein